MSTGATQGPFVALSRALEASSAESSRLMQPTSILAMQSQTWPRRAQERSVWVHARRTSRKQWKARSPGHSSPASSRSAGSTPSASLRRAPATRSQAGSWPATTLRSASVMRMAALMPSASGSRIMRLTSASFVWSMQSSNSRFKPSGFRANCSLRGFRPSEFCMNRVSGATARICMALGALLAACSGMLPSSSLRVRSSVSSVRKASRTATTSSASSALISARCRASSSPLEPPKSTSASKTACASTKSLASRSSASCALRCSCGCVASSVRLEQPRSSCSSCLACSLSDRGPLLVFMKCVDIMERAVISSTSKVMEHFPLLAWSLKARQSAIGSILCPLNATARQPTFTRSTKPTFTTALPSLPPRTSPPPPMGTSTSSSGLPGPLCSSAA
mmetsp:Transcript_41188/g.119049  ORF Transcript_41188/g.119049 Transcript_41188/m.119049 type:complete len:393 (-) Transcript_41188:385-1563(-)